MATSQDVDYSVRDHTAWLTMNRPGVLNALSKGMFRGLELALASASSDPPVHSIVIRGEGRAFSAGLDVKEVSGFATQKEAREFGLVNYVEEPGGIENRVTKILDEMRHVSPTSNASFKRIHGSLITARILNVAYKELLRTITSPDFRTGATAFARKEPPEYYK